MALDIVLNQSTVMNYLESEVDFPVDFDYAWQWAGYSTKQKALLKLKNHFADGEDFLTKRCKSPTGGRPSSSYYLTNDCFKMFCMMAGTEKGSEVRRYYIACEKALKERWAAQIATPAIAPLPIHIQEINILSNAFKQFKLDESPRHVQLVQDRIANLLAGQSNDPLLASTRAIAPPKWYGVAEIAEQLGFNAYEVSKHRSSLGRVVAAWYRDSEGKEPQVEKRLVNGRTCDLKVYQRTDDLDTTISIYLANKGIEAA